MRNYPHLLGIGDDHAVNMRCQDLDDGSRIARRLDDDVIVVRKLLLGELLQPLTQYGDVAELHQLAIEHRHGLGCYPVDVHADNPHCLLLGPTRLRELAGNTTLTDVPPWFWSGLSARFPDV